VTQRLRAALVGAGRRGFGAHFPALRDLRQEVEIVGICELDAERLARGAEFFDLPPDFQYQDLDRMLEETRPDLVYAIMWPHILRPVVERAFQAGAHVVMEKPPGASVEDVEAMLEASRRAGRQGMVAFQRRHAAVVREALRRIEARGPLTLCLAEFHKDLLQSGPPFYGVTTLWDDAVHAVDLARFLCGGEVSAVHAYAEAPFTDWPTDFNALLRFRSGATALLTASRSTGGRFMRFEAHGRELAAYMDDFPARVRFVSEDGKQSEELSGAQLSGSEVGRTYDGVLEMHRHFLESIRTGQPATSTLEDALQTMRLVQRIERAEH
jgi:virulence factor